LQEQQQQQQEAAATTTTTITNNDYNRTIKAMTATTATAKVVAMPKLSSTGAKHKYRQQKQADSYSSPRAFHHCRRRFSELR